jgi:MFS family permease
MRDLARLARSRGFAGRVALAGAFTAFTVSDAFVFLTLLERNESLASFFPLLAVGLGLAYAALAIPMGRLADRLGRMRTYLIGHVVLLGVYVLVAGPLGAIPGTILTLLMLGLYYAATDGVLAASVSAVLPEEARTTGLALAQTVVAGAAMVSSVVFGLLLGTLGIGQAYLIMGAGLLLVLLVARPMLVPAAQESQEVE